MSVLLDSAMYIRTISNMIGVFLLHICCMCIIKIKNKLTKKLGEVKKKYAVPE